MNNLERMDRSALARALEAAGALVMAFGAVRCPFHPDGKPSGSIYQGLNGVWRYRCHALECGFQGDIFDVRAKRTGKPLAEILSGRAETPLKTHNAPPPPPSSPATEKVASRRVYGVISEIAPDIPGTIEGEYHYFDPETNLLRMVIFRYRRPDGSKSFRQYHRTDEGYVIGAAEKPWPLYNAMMAKGASKIVVVEGEKCVDALARYGIRAVTNPCGAGKAAHADWSPLAGQNVILWPDNDQAGREHMMKVREILEYLNPAPSIAIVEPNDLKLSEKQDVADYIEQNKDATKDCLKEILELTLAAAEPWGFAQDLQRILDDTISGKRRALDWPWKRIGNLTKALLPGTVTLICGDPGSGKSFMLLEALVYWHIAGTPVAVYELEDSKEYHVFRALAQNSGMAAILDDAWVRNNEPLARSIFQQHKAFMMDFSRCITANPDADVTLAGIAEWIEKQAEAGKRIIAVDVVSVATKGREEWKEDLLFMNRVKQAARNHDCSVILVTHPREGDKFSLDNIAGGKAYQRLSQTVIWIERFKQSKEVAVYTGDGAEILAPGVNGTVRIVKSRNGKGQGCSIAMRLNGQCLKFEEVGLIKSTK